MLSMAFNVPSGFCAEDTVEQGTAGGPRECSIMQERERVLDQGKAVGYR